MDNRLSMEVGMDACCASLKSNLTMVPYSVMVEIFGEPNGQCDDYKTDVEWCGELDGDVFTIYNWKNGYNYRGGKGIAVKDMTEWHVGGIKESIGLRIKQYILEYCIEHAPNVRMKI